VGQCCYIMTPHQKRRFPEKVEFMTSLDSSRQRWPRESWPARQRHAWRGDRHWYVRADETGEMILTALHPGKMVEEARANTAGT